MRLFFDNLKAYNRSKDGHVAVLFALLAVPLLIFCGLAIDTNNMNSERVHLSAALDSAALSAVTNQGLTEAERKAYAAQVFWDNVGDRDASIQLTVLDAKNSRVALVATAEINMTFGLLDDDGKVTVSDNATAELTSGEVVCMLALSPDGERAFEVTGGAKLRAPSCSVQVNSSNARAAVIDHGGEALAQNFCISGGASGTFDPFVNTECSAIPDPFLDKRHDLGGKPCVDQDALEQKLSSWQADVGVTLQPGVYCEGLHLIGKNVTFAPGTYVMKGYPLILDYGTRAYADGATFVLLGNDAVFKANEGAVAYIKAPSDGEFAGLAFFQDTYTNAKNFKSLPTGESVIARGSDVTVVGVVYMPEQKLAFRGGSLLENQAPATSFIGYKISIGDGSVVEVSVDHQIAGLPPIEPRSDDSARLSE